MNLYVVGNHLVSSGLNVFLNRSGLDGENTSIATYSSLLVILSEWGIFGGMVKEWSFLMVYVSSPILNVPSPFRQYPRCSCGCLCSRRVAPGWAIKYIIVILLPFPKTRTLKFGWISKKSIFVVSVVAFALLSVLLNTLPLSWLTNFQHFTIHCFLSFLFVCVP